MKLLKPGLDERRLRAFLGDVDYRFHPPAVCSAFWTARDWARFVTFTEPDRYGSLNR